METGSFVGLCDFEQCRLCAMHQNNVHHHQPTLQRKDGCFADQPLNEKNYFLS